MLGTAGVDESINTLTIHAGGYVAPFHLQADEKRWDDDWRPTMKALTLRVKHRMEFI
jgi:hypothetical protein